MAENKWGFTGVKTPYEKRGYTFIYNLFLDTFCWWLKFYRNTNFQTVFVESFPLHPPYLYNVPVVWSWNQWTREDIHKSRNDTGDVFRASEPAFWRVLYHKICTEGFTFFMLEDRMHFVYFLVGGWTNLFEKHSSKWESSPNGSEHKKYLKLPPRCWIVQMPNSISFQDSKMLLLQLSKIIVIPQMTIGWIQINKDTYINCTCNWWLKKSWSFGVHTKNIMDTPHIFLWQYTYCSVYINLVHFSICACHPCAWAMLIFSVSFQFYL